MNVKIVRAPSRSTLELIKRRSRVNLENNNPGAIGLIQGKFIEMVYLADICEKTSNVQVLDLVGNCPQSMILLALIGSVAEVEAALEKAKQLDK